MATGIGANPITVMLVDDHPVVRAGYRRLLESEADIKVVAEADDGETGCILYERHKPNVLILDLHMSGIDGLETIRRIKAKDPDAHILVFSMLSNEILVQRVLLTGAMGYLSKQCRTLGNMIQAVRQINQGKIYIDPDLAMNVAALALKDSSKDPLNVLSPREFQIFKLLAEGNSTLQISEILSISLKTVGGHHTSIMKKLNLENPTQLVRLAILCGVIQV